MAGPDPLATTKHAKLLAAGFDKQTLEQLRTETAEAIGSLRVSIVMTEVSTTGCGLDGSYDATTNTISVDPATNHARQRFTLLHELGHKLMDDNDEVVDWLFSFGDAFDDTVEALADAFAAAILLPDEMVAQKLPPNFTARDLADLADLVTASREALVVRASQHLRAPGIVAIANGPDVLFSSSRSLPFRVGRGVTQPADSIFATVTPGVRKTVRRGRVMLRTGLSHTDLDGDAWIADDGLTFAVLRDSGPDVDHRGQTWGGRSSWTCRSCKQDISDAEWCESCAQRRCLDCGCKCPPTLRPAVGGVCSVHFIQLPGSGICDLCQ